MSKQFIMATIVNRPKWPKNSRRPIRTKRPNMSKNSKNKNGQKAKITIMTKMIKMKKQPKRFWVKITKRKRRQSLKFPTRPKWGNVQKTKNAKRPKNQIWPKSSKMVKKEVKNGQNGNTEKSDQTGQIEQNF